MLHGADRKYKNLMVMKIAWKLGQKREISATGVDDFNIFMIYASFNRIPHT